ncbi:NAD(P)-binding protein [Hypomontagnella monticulosa]|nr:NAD(P)-binding protein [Hypomontagnella monticulosa]
MDITGNAFITGGGSGIGKACCIAFAKEGASGIIVADLNLKTAEETVAEVTAVASNPAFRAASPYLIILRFCLLAVHIDVTKEESVSNAVKSTVESFQRIDYCIHCAGIPMATYYPISEAKFDEFKHLMDVHVNGTFLVTQLVVKAMMAQELKPISTSSLDRGSTRGAIVILGSVASYFTTPNWIQYNTAKHAVLNISKTAAIENVAHGIRVNCLCPTYIETSLFRQATEVIPGLSKNAPSHIPMGRIGRPEEVADGALYLCSPRSSFVTGIILPIDGGQSLVK